MTAITTSEARRDLFGLIERVNLDQTEVEITSKRGSAVLMSLDEYNALIETSYLLRSPKNAERLLTSLKEAREGQVVEHSLEEPGSDPSPQLISFFSAPTLIEQSGQSIEMVDDPEEHPIR